MKIARFNYSQPNAKAALAEATQWEAVADQTLNQRVDDIIQQVRQYGDRALMDLTEKLDGHRPDSLEILGKHGRKPAAASPLSLNRL